MQNLAELSIGSKGEMVQIYDNSLEQKLLEMGCTPGEQFEVVRKAPFGGPIAILISSYILSIRKEDAKSIAVKLLVNE
ncbi:MAG: FeoA family protein [Bacteroidetes bacterium]|jgi:ferrous iron transport protein A|nr:ferrous iron transport protein A [Cryomorphaceae bacterium]MDA0890243.1 FeoA family protein [Bacteroidota bacterium]